MPHSQEELAFTAPAEVQKFHGLLFDMDGTLIDSTAAIVKHWTKIGQEMGVDPEAILATSHGRRTIDVLRELDPSKASMEYVQKVEGLIPRTYGADAVEIPGARAVLDALQKVGAPWSIVTSGTRGLVTGWFEVMKLAHPAHVVAAEDVKNGKPDPEGYRLGARRLNLATGAKALVFEDAPAGVRAGKAAGFQVVALATTHTVQQLKDAGADWIVEDMRSISVRDFDSKSGQVSIEISKALVK